VISSLSIPPGVATDLHEAERHSADGGCVAAIGQPLLDIIVPCDRSLLERHRFAPGSHEFLTGQEISTLLAQISDDSVHLFTGGSALNSVKSARMLGLDGAYYGLTGYDPAGARVRELLWGEKIVAPIQATKEHPTGVCVSLITPNGERTMRTNLGASALLSAKHLQGLSLHRHAWVVLEGYLLVSGEHNRSALFAALSALESARDKVVFCLASEYVASIERDVIFASVLPRTGLLIANEREACALTETSCATDALNLLEKHLPGVIITCGERGAWTFFGGERFFTPACTNDTAVVDTTGAGDVYLGAFLAGLSTGHSPRLAASGAARMAALVVSKHGSDLPRTAKDIWVEVMGK
jgi:sugar/nucleoside kinase (ribokinase family)